MAAGQHQTGETVGRFGPRAAYPAQSRRHDVALLRLATPSSQLTIPQFALKVMPSGNVGHL